MKHLCFLFAFLVIFLSCSQTAEQPPKESSTSVTIPDENLAAAIRGTLKLEPRERITQQKLNELTTLSAYKRNIADLTGLEKANNLNTLEFFENRISDISPLTALTNLKHLNLQGNHISDLTQVGKIGQLSKLSILRNPIQDLSPLTQLTNLTELVLGNNQFTDISPLADLVHLTTLYLGSDQIRDIAPLTHLKQLTKLSLYNTPISDITLLRELKQLKKLHLPDNQISDLSPLTEMRELTTLVLGGNQIRDISQLSGLFQLKELSLGRNQISDITPLTELIHLEKLVLYGNKITDITPLTKLTQLKELRLMGNQITDISPLAALTELTYLGLEYNTIQDIKPIENLKNLKKLYLKQNPVEDVSPIYTLYKNNKDLNTGDPPYPPLIGIYDKQNGLPDCAIARLGKGGINVIRFAPDGNTLVVGTDIGLWIYDVNTQKVKPLSRRTIGQVNAVTFSPDGNTLACGGNANPVIQLWDVHNGKELATLSLPSSQTINLKPFKSTKALTFSRGGTTLVSIAEYGYVTNWDVATGRIIEEFQTDYDTWSTAFSLSEQGDVFARGYGNGEIWLRDTFSGAIEAKLRGHKPYFGASKKNTGIRALAFSTDGNILASGSNDKTVRLWNTKRRSKRATLKGHTGWITAIAFSKIGETVASGDTDSTIRVWDVKKKKERAVLKGHKNAIVSLAFSADGKTIASASADGTIRFWTTETWEEKGIFAKGHTESVEALAFSEDDTFISSAMFNNTVNSYDVKTGHQIKEFGSGIQQQTYAVQLSQDATLLACNAVNGAMAFNMKGWRRDRRHKGVGTIHIWDMKKGEKLPTPLNAFGKMEFSPDNTMLAASSSAGISSWVVGNNSIASSGGSEDFGLWNVVNGEKLQTFDIKGSSSSSPLSFSPDGSILASTTSFGGTHLWNVETKQKFDSVIEDHGDRLVFSPDSKMLAIKNNWKIHLWEFIAEAEVQKQQTLDNVKEGYNMTFSPDGQILLITSSSTGRYHCRDVEIQLWDIAANVKLHSLPGHTEPIKTLVFSHDGKTLASGSRDGTVLLWNWDEIIRDIMLENRWQNDK